MMSYSFCLGFYAFGVMGVIYGPVLYALMWVIYEITRRISLCADEITFDKELNRKV